MKYEKDQWLAAMKRERAERKARRKAFVASLGTDAAKTTVERRGWRVVENRGVCPVAGYGRRG